jgi:SAM-dependent methyltransferase
MGLKLNLGSGKEYLKDFVNVDSCEPADKVFDLDKFPYPFKENSVDFILASHIVEHLKNPEGFFDEIYRIMKPGAKAIIKVPHYKAKGAYCCFGHRGFYHEEAIKSICNERNYDGNDLKPKFRLISIKVKRGRFLKWQKREITWEIKK